KAWTWTWNPATGKWTWRKNE
nr:Chain A, xtz1-peptide [unidentified]